MFDKGQTDDIILVVVTNKGVFIIFTQYIAIVLFYILLFGGLRKLK